MDSGGKWVVGCGGKWVVGCGFDHCRNGSRCQGRNCVHLKRFDCRFQVPAHDGSDLLNLSTGGGSGTS